MSRRQFLSVSYCSSFSLIQLKVQFTLRLTLIIIPNQIDRMYYFQYLLNLLISCAMGIGLKSRKGI